jgi:hypothetical protein
MKLHKTKDMIAVVSAIVGVICLSFDKCYADMKQMYYIFFLSTIIIIDSIFIFHKNAYRIDFGKNRLTFFIIFIYITIYLMIFKYIVSCNQ